MTTERHWEVPQIDLEAAYLSARDEIDGAVARVLASGWYVLGKEVAQFEEEFARYLHVQHVVGVASGTDALMLALRACGIGPGDGVLTVAHTAVATVAAIELAGASPVFVDIDPLTYTMDPASVSDALSRWSLPLRPAALVVVHLYGQPAEMRTLSDIARRHGLLIVEDCAQSHGATLDERAVGSWGDVAAFSFYPTKNLGAFGDGGAVATENDNIADRVRRLRQYGWSGRRVSDEAGTNSRLDELQAAVLRVRLHALEGENTRRRELAAAYEVNLSSTGVGLPIVRENAVHVYHQYAVNTSGRENLKRYLEANGVQTAVHYPVPVHLHPAYQGSYRLSDLKVTEHAASRVLSLPMYPQLTDSALAHVTDAITAWARNGE